jgi:hypothetical protein
VLGTSLQMNLLYSPAFVSQFFDLLRGVFETSSVVFFVMPFVVMQKLKSGVKFVKNFGFFLVI